MTNKKGRNTLEQEISYVIPGLFILPGAALTGILTHLVAGQADWQQWLYIAHALLGIALTVILPLYTFFHIKRTLGVRRVGTIISGWFAFLIMAGLAGTGIFIVIFGQTETTRWIFRWHIYTAYACLALIAAHIVAHRYMYNKQAGTANFHRHPSLLSKNIKQAGLSLGLLTVILLALIFSGKMTTYFDRPVEIADYDYPFGPNPFFPSETATVNNQFVRQEQIAGSPQCGSCHEQIFKEWRASIHSQAASDPAYATNINLTVKARGMAAVRNCEGCHSAVALLSGQIKEGGQHSAVPDTIAHSEGIGCFTCHGISRVVHPKGNGSYEFNPQRGYLFAYSGNIFARKLHNFLIRVHPEEHRKIMARPVLASPQICAACHVQFMDTVLNDVGWIKMQDEYSAWLQSSYSGQTNQRFARHDTLRCQDCHMFPVANPDDPSANELGMARSHRWLGANTAIPTVTGDHEQVRLTREFLQADRVRIHIERPWRKDAPQSALYVSEAIRARSETPFFFYLGERASFDITVTNHLVGHDFPGGTIDINEVWVSFRVVDATDNLIFESGKVDKEGNVDPNANFYYAIPVDKTGKQVWKHDLFRMTGESYRNVIPAGQTDMLNYQFDVPYWAKTPLTVSATVRYRKFNNRYAKFALGERYQTLPIVDMAEDILTVPLLTKPPGIEN